MLELNTYWDNNPSILKSVDEWKALFVTLNSCEEASSEKMVEKAVDFSTQPSTMLLLKTPRKYKMLTVKTENLKLGGDSFTYFDILLKKQCSLIEVQK